GVRPLSARRRRSWSYVCPERPWRSPCRSPGRRPRSELPRRGMLARRARTLDTSPTDPAAERKLAGSEGVADTMPANLTPEYRAAEASFRKARDPRERLESLREMLRVIPKHKGTDHLQGDIKRRIKELADELERPKRGGGHAGPALVIRPEGAAQIP